MRDFHRIPRVLPKGLVRCRALLLASALVFALAAAGNADIRYRSYAAKMMNALPADAAVRPDLEIHLSKLANLARAKHGRAALIASRNLVEAARAQAAEMILGNFVGHHSAAGFDFGDRFRAYLPGFKGLRGENAARVRRGGPPDRSKSGRLFGQWLRSGRHRRNLLNRNYGFISSGVIQVGTHLYAVQIYWEKPATRESTSPILID